MAQIEGLALIVMAHHHNVGISNKLETFSMRKGQI